MADPIVLHDNPDLDGQYPDNVGIHAGFNDTHELQVEGPSLVGRPTADTGPAKKILVDPPLYFDAEGDLNIDFSAVTIAQASITALQNRVTNDEATISTLQGQVASLQAQMLQVVLRQFTISPSAFNGVGSLTASLRAFSYLTAPAFTATGSLTAVLMTPRFAQASFAGAGSLLADISGPRSLGNTLLSAIGSLTTNLIVSRPVQGNWAAGGNLTGALSVGLAGAATFTATGALTASLFNSRTLLQPVQMAASGALTVDVTKSIPGLTPPAFAAVGAFSSVVSLNMPIQQVFAAVGGFSPPALRQNLVVKPQVFAGTGAMAVSSAGFTVLSGYSAWDPANSDVAHLTLSNSNRTATSIPGAAYGAVARGTKAITTGAKYFEVKFVTTPDLTAYESVGIWDASFSGYVGTGVGEDSGGYSIGLRCLGTGTYSIMLQGIQVVSTPFIPAIGDVIGVAVDTVNRTLAFSVNGIWLNTSGMGPSSTLAGVDYHYAIGTPITVPYPATSVPYLSGAIQHVLNVGNAAFVYPIPPGYTAWG